MFQLDSCLMLHPVVSSILFSSVSSIVAPTGQPNYAAANAILNSHANSKAAMVSFLINSAPCLQAYLFTAGKLRMHTDGSA